MNTSFQKGSNTTDEWYTPECIVRSLGSFDLDPCAPAVRAFDTATKHFTKEDDGLSLEWYGRIWLNPPCSRSLIEPFMRKLADHGNGIALIFARTDSKMFHEQVFDRATALLFMRGRVRFLRPDYTQGDAAGYGSVLIAYGHENAFLLKTSGIEGKYIEL